MISKTSIQMTRWSDVLFVALLFGGATGLAVMETKRAATYDSEYAAYCQTQEAAREHFGRAHLQTINVHKLPYEAFLGTAQSYAVEEVNQGGMR